MTDLDGLARELSWAASPLLSGPLESRPHQREAFEKLRNSKVFALAMKCRTGKTKIGVDLACHHVTAGRVR